MSRNRTPLGGELPLSGRLVAIDLGEVRVGIAVSDPGQVVASPAETLHVPRDQDAPLIEALANAATRHEAAAVVVHRADGLAMDELRQLASEIRGNLATRAVVVVGAASDDGKAQLICAVTRDLADAGVEARPILHPAAQVVGGGAGGKGDLAQAGGKQGDKLDEALQVAATEARRVVGEL